MRTEDLINMIRSGETVNIEFKKKFVKDLARDVCAFLNTDGGCVLIGIDDDGGIVGTDGNEEQRISDVLLGIKPPANFNIGKTMIDEKKIFWVCCKRSPRMHSFGNIVYLRIGKNNRPLDTEDLLELASESLFIFFDQMPSSVSKEEVNKDLVRRYLKERSERRGSIAKGNFVDDLKSSKITSSLKGHSVLTNGGLLFFTENPQYLLPQSSVRLVWFNDEKMRDFKADIDFNGSLWKIVDDIYEYLILNLKKIGGMYQGWKREDLMEYPMDALREAIINSVIHRNYLDPGQIQIFIFPDRLEISNPGSFPPGIDIESPEHKPRNPLLCQYMFDIGYVERYGIGLKRIVDSCKEHPLVDVEFQLSSYRTKVIFKKYIDSKLDDIDSKILTYIFSEENVKSEDIAAEIGISKRYVTARLRNLSTLGLVIKKGKGKATRYSPNKE
jgi:ATP-dependent DNA helicase RecG